MNRSMNPLLTFLAIGALAAPNAPAQQDSAQRAASAPETATGVVFHDRDGDGQRDSGEPGIGEVRVSNGEAVALTGDDGRYELPVRGHAILFVCKPRGWIYPTDENNLPQFSYIHKPEGSPDDDFKYRGSEPTGPLPESIDFPLHRYDDADAFRAVLLGDPQPASIQEVRFFGRDIMTELAGVDAAFGVSLGDIVSNDLDLFEPMNEMQALAGIPWHNVIGNHDLNFQAAGDQHANETFHRVYGPSDYAFQYGKVHFLAMDNVVYHGRDDRGYHGGLNERQLSFLENYLKTVPTDHRILIGTHIPLTNTYSDEQHATPQLGRVLEILSEFPHTASFSAHTHVNAIYHLEHEPGGHSHGSHSHGEHSHREHSHGDHTHADHDHGGGVHGVHIHHNVGTASGTWWKGPRDSRGIPMTTMRDGTPNGYAIATFDGPEMRVKWKAAHHEADYQMNIDAPDSLAAEQLGTDRAEVLVNVFNGSDRSTVEMRVPGHTEWTEMRHEHRMDPFYVRQQARDQANPTEDTKRLNEPRESTHIWVGVLPEGLPAGTHLIEVRADDAYGHVFTDKRPFRVRRTEEG